MSGALSSQKNNFKQEKREFWLWPVFLISMIVGTIFFYQSYHLDREVWKNGVEITVKVFDKIPAQVKKRSKIGIMHGHIPIYVYAGKSWYRSTAVGSETKVKYSPLLHAYLDPYHKFDKDLFFLFAMIFMDLILLWRTIWLGLYIWKWK